MKLHEFLISPPFGNWISHPKCTRVRGSFTLEPRPGLWRQVARTVRPVPGGWVNAIGLRNPGIRAIPFDPEDVISVAGLGDGDWDRIREVVPAGQMVELNLGCPNAGTYGYSLDALRAWTREHLVIAKLPPTEAVHEAAMMCAGSGIRYLHVSNTLPSPRGGISGRQLFEHNLPLVRKLAKRFVGLTIIAGGGIYDRTQLDAYREAGAAHFSLSTVWFTPWRARRLLRDGV